MFPFDDVIMAKEFDALLAQDWVYCGNKTRKIGLNHDYHDFNMTLLYDWRSLQ